MSLKEQKDILKPFATMFESMAQFAASASDTDLVGIIDACNAMTETNCGWSTFRAAQAVRKEADEEIRMRARRLSETERKDP